MLNIKNFSKSYDGKKFVVNDLNLHVNSGEIFGFIGHNGAGKSTTIKSIAGILEFDCGDILINGHSIKSEPIHCKRTIAYIPDTPYLYEFLTALEYIYFICNMFEIPRERVNSGIEKYSALFEMENFLGKKISTYSHGMKQKTLLMAALVRNPKLLVLDEPFVGLDPKSSFVLKEIMKQHCENGNSIFFSTHVLEVAEKICDKIAIINKGKLVVSGETKNIVNEKSLENIFMEAIKE